MANCGYCYRPGSGGDCMSTTAGSENCFDYWIDFVADCP